MGVKKAQEAPIATAIKNVSGFKPSVVAMLYAIGAIRIAVAALFNTSDTVIVTTRISASNSTGE